MRFIDFSTWQGVLTTLAGLAMFTLIGVGIRVLMMLTIQQRQQRMNRQINERLKTLISAYKVLGGSFTGRLSVDPSHMGGRRRSAETAVLSGPEAGAVLVAALVSGGYSPEGEAQPAEPDPKREQLASAADLPESAQARDLSQLGEAAPEGQDGAAPDQMDDSPQGGGAGSASRPAQSGEAPTRLEASQTALAGSRAEADAQVSARAAPLLTPDPSAPAAVPATAAEASPSASEGPPNFVLERRAQIRDAVEAALADILLLGTEEHVRLAGKAAADLAEGRVIQTAELVVALRDYIRKSLDLEPIPKELAIPAQGPTRPSGGGRGAGRGGAGGPGGGGGGGGGAGGAGGGGMGMGMGMGMGLGRRSEQDGI